MNEDKLFDVWQLLIDTVRDEDELIELAMEIRSTVNESLSEFDNEVIRQMNYEIQEKQSVMTKLEIELDCLNDNLESYKEKCRIE